MSLLLAFQKPANMWVVPFVVDPIFAFSRPYRKIKLTLLFLYIHENSISKARQFLYDKFQLSVDSILAVKLPPRRPTTPEPGPSCPRRLVSILIIVRRQLYSLHMFGGTSALTGSPYLWIEDTEDGACNPSFGIYADQVSIQR